MKRFIRMENVDMVATALDDVLKGDVVGIYNSQNHLIYEMQAIENILFGNKIALLDIAQKENVIKYGSSIGETTHPIAKGALVHIHNVRSLVVDIPPTFKTEIMRQMGIEPIKEG